MTVQKVSNALIYCLAADTKPTVYADNTLAYVVDTGDIYRSTSGVWNLIQGASKAETLTNKTITANSNTIMKNFFTNGLDGSNVCGLQQPCGTADVFVGALWGQNLRGTYSTVAWNVTDYYGAKYTSTTTANSMIGHFTPLAQATMSRDPRIKVEFLMDSSASARLFIGWNSNLTMPVTDTLLGATDKGYGFGFRSTDTNFTIFSNDGVTALTATAMSTPVAKTAVTAKHTIEIITNSAVPNVQFIWDDTNITTLTADLPATSTTMALYVIAENTTTTARAITFYRTETENS